MTQKETFCNQTQAFYLAIKSKKPALAGFLLAILQKRKNGVSPCLLPCNQKNSQHYKMAFCKRQGLTLISANLFKWLRCWADKALAQPCILSTVVVSYYHTRQSEFGPNLKALTFSCRSNPSPHFFRQIRH